MEEVGKSGKRVRRELGESGEGGRRELGESVGTFNDKFNGGSMMTE